MIPFFTYIYTCLPSCTIQVPVYVCVQLTSVCSDASCRNFTAFPILCLELNVVTGIETVCMTHPSKKDVDKVVRGALEVFLPVSSRGIARIISFPVSSDTCMQYSKQSTSINECSESIAQRMFRKQTVRGSVSNVLHW